MKITLASLGEVKRVIIVICPNHFGLHASVYVRYIILLDNAEPPHAIWIDDPTEQEVVHIIHHLYKEAEKELSQAPCQWCEARGENPYGVQ